MTLFPAKKDEPSLVPMPRRVVEKHPEVRMSESYAKALQEFSDIQATLREAQDERDQLKVDLGVEIRENDNLRNKVERLEEQLKIYKDRCIRIEAQFDDAAALILRVIDSRLTEKKPPPQIPVEKLEQELVAIEEKPREP